MLLFSTGGYHGCCDWKHFHYGLDHWIDGGDGQLAPALSPRTAGRKFRRFFDGTRLFSLGKTGTVTVTGGRRAVRFEESPFRFYGIMRLSARRATVSACAEIPVSIHGTPSSLSAHHALAPVVSREALDFPKNNDKKAPFGGNGCIEFCESCIFSVFCFFCLLPARKKKAARSRVPLQFRQSDRLRSLKGK